MKMDKNVAVFSRFRNNNNNVMSGKLNRNHPYNKQNQGQLAAFPAGIPTVMADGPVQTENFINTETFHTPSFGDEDFDINSLTLPPPVSENIAHSESISQVFSSAQSVLSHPPLGNMDLSQSLISSLESSIVPKFPPQNFEVPDISVTNSLNILSQISQSQFVTMNNISVSDTRLSTMPHQNVSSQLRLGNKQGSPISHSKSPNRESSDESDDSLPLAQLAMMKRQAMAANAPVVSTSHENSPEPPTSTTTAVAKKPKTPKKKKKKDPNEPQKPVSAYALFFRDTQAAIKGQNPNASFGEVSKIVASMWDGLDPDHKNSYKKKTEMAKKEYLKQLAAYRASLVSQNGLDRGSVFSLKPAGVKNGRLQLQAGENSVFSGKPMGRRTRQQQAQMSPDEGLSPLGHNAGTLQSPSQLSQSSMSPPQPDMMGGMQPLSATSPNHPVMRYNSPPHLQYQHSPPDIAPRPSIMDNIMDGNSQLMYSKWCVRNGCSNVALDNPGWDNEYCSNECVVSHCRDVFTAWAASRPGSNSFQVK